MILLFASIISIITFVLFLICIPTLTGYYLSKRLAMTQNFYVFYLLGSIFLWACTQMIVAPLVMLRATFYLPLFLTVALYISGGIAGFLQYGLKLEFVLDPKSLLAFNRKTLKDSSFITALFSIILSTIIVILVISHQGTVYSDVHYIVSAVDMLKSGRMFLSNPASGAIQTHFTRTYLSDLTSPWAFQYAFLGVVTFTKPIVAAHIVLPVQIIILCTCIYQLFAKHYSAGNPLYHNIFFFLMWVIQILGCYSSYCAEACLMVRPWQPAAAVASVGLPLIIYLFLLIDKNPDKKTYFYALAAVNISLCYMHKTGMILGLLSCLGFSICYSARKKSLSILKCSLITVIPNMLFWIINSFNTASSTNPAGLFKGNVFEKIVNSFHLYTGDKLVLIIGIFSMIMLYIISKKQTRKLIYPITLSIALSFVLLLIGLLPMDMIPEGIYWLFPEALFISIFFVHILKKAATNLNRGVICGVLAILLLISGNLFYKEANMHTIENIEKIDGQCKKVYDHILDGDAAKSCIFCDDYIWTARQYNGNITMPYAYNEDGSLTFAHAHDQSLPHMMTRLFELSYFICENASQNNINYIVLKANHHLQIRYLKSHHFYVSARIGDTIIYAYTPPSQVKKLDYISKQLHLGRSGFFRALRQIDSKRLSKYDEQEKKDRRRRKEQKDKKRN